MMNSGVWNSKIAISNLVGSKYVRTTRFASIGSGTSGTVTLPSSSTVVLDDFGGTVDAIITTITGGRPDTVAAVTATGAVVGTTFDSSGNWVLSGTPSAYPVAIIYRVRQTLVNFDSTSSDIMGDAEITTGFPDGTATAPGGFFASDSDNGFYRSAANIWNLVAGGFVAMGLGKSTGSYANVGLGVAPSTSDQFPVLIERINASSSTGIGVSNPSNAANSNAKVQVSCDAGNVVGSINAYAASATIDAFGPRMVIRTDSSAQGINFLVNATAPNNVKFYFGGGATTNEVLRIDANGLRFLTQSARPAASSSIRGLMYYTISAGGVTDKIEICMKSAADTYNWITIVTGG